MKWATIAFVIAGAAAAADVPTTPPPKSALLAPIVREDEWKSSDPAEVVVRRLRMAKDKRAFVDLALAVGGGGHLYVARQAIDRCYPVVAAAGKAGAEKGFANGYLRDDPQNERRLAAFRALHAGCEGFTQRPVTKAEYLAIQNGINVQYESMARASTLSRMEAEERRRVARLLIEEGDPVVIGWVGFQLTHRKGAEMGPMRTDDARFRELEIEQRAWRYAACELSIECRAGGASDNYDCAYRGYCDDPMADERLRNKRDEIVAAIRGRDWAKLGL